MIHHQFIQILKKLAPDTFGLRAMLLIGSCGRSMYSANSDIDIQLLVSDKFVHSQFIQLLSDKFSSYGCIIRSCGLPGKLAVYFEQYPKIDVAIYTELSAINRDFFGSELKDLSTSVLYVCPKEQASLFSHLQELVTQGATQPAMQDVDCLIDRFVYEYERASSMHQRGDVYQFYYFYHLALQCVVQLTSLAHGVTSFNYLPKHFATQCSRAEQMALRQLSGTLFLPECNASKRRLLDFFYSQVERVAPYKLESVRKFCELIYKRDYFWNFRDLTRNISCITPQFIYRSPALCLVLEPDKVLALLEQHQITTIIDLRALNKDNDKNQVCFRNEEAGSYQPQLLQGRNYVLADLDPWAQPRSFVDSEYHTGTNAEIAYRFFVVGCNRQICLIMKSIIEAPRAVLIHCFSGKDRTGIIVAMLALLAGSRESEIIQDYLASEQDTQVSLIRIVLDFIAQCGGIEAYLLNCGLNKSQIQTLKQKLIYG